MTYNNESGGLTPDEDDIARRLIDEVPKDRLEIVGPDVQGVIDSANADVRPSSEVGWEDLSGSERLRKLEEVNNFYKSLVILFENLAAGLESSQQQDVDTRVAGTARYLLNNFVTLFISVISNLGKEIEYERSGETGGMGPEIISQTPIILEQLRFLADMTSSEEIRRLLREVAEQILQQAN